MSGTPSVTHTTFRFYSEEELADIAAVEIKDPNSFSDMNLPNRNGLYDPRMGPIDSLSSCKTCGLSEERCPGHMGYIRLPQPVIHPLLRNELVRLLNNCCLYCSKFRITKTKVRERLIS
jgi:DNA-directed RNA polymerase I subunit RPA1